MVSILGVHTKHPQDESSAPGDCLSASIESPAILFLSSLPLLINSSFASPLLFSCLRCSWNSQRHSELSKFADLLGAPGQEQWEREAVYTAASQPQQVSLGALSDARTLTSRPPPPTSLPPFSLPPFFLPLPHPLSQLPLLLSRFSPHRLAFFFL